MLQQRHRCSGRTVPALSKVKANFASVKRAGPVIQHWSPPGKDIRVRRGFRGELHHVRHGSELIRIRSGGTAVDLREEA